MNYRLALATLLIKNDTFLATPRSFLEVCCVTHIRIRNIELSLASPKALAYDVVCKLESEELAELCLFLLDEAMPKDIPVIEELFEGFATEPTLITKKGN